MKIKVRMWYMDGKNLDVEILETMAEQFFKDLNAGSMFWSEHSSSGFWTSIEKIRYIEVFSDKKNVLQECQKSFEQVCVEDGTDSITA